MTRFKGAHAVTTATKRCPKCLASWVGPPIPVRDRENFGGATHFDRQIGIYSTREDRTVAFHCPDCGATFLRR